MRTVHLSSFPTDPWKVTPLTRISYGLVKTEQSFLGHHFQGICYLLYAKDQGTVCLKSIGGNSDTGFWE